MAMRRRDFLSAAGVVAAAPLAAWADDAAPARPLDLVQLGKAFRTSRIGFGTGMRGGMRQSNQTRMGSEAFENLLRYAYDEGIRLFDLADLYGTHAFVARALANKPRDSYQLATKIWWRPKGIPEPERPDADVVVRRFLAELKTEYIDLVQLHCVVSGNWPDELRRQMDLLAELKSRGVVRAHGVSSHSLEGLEAAAASPWVDVVHARINPTGAKMDGPPERVVPVLQKIHAAGKGIIGMKIIGEGSFKEASQRRDSVRFVMGLGCVDAMIVGFESRAQIDEFTSLVAAARKAAG